MDLGDNLIDALAEHGAVCVPFPLETSFPLWVAARKVLMAKADVTKTRRWLGGVKVDVPEELSVLGAMRDRKSTIDVNADILDQSLSDELKFMKVAFTDAMKFAIELLSHGHEGSTPDFPGSVLRHLFYEPGGTAGEHTDYGVLTLQSDTCEGFEARIDGDWRKPVVPTGHVIVYGGKWLEFQTKGKVVALEHRVRSLSRRQSHVFFVQPAETAEENGVLFGDYKTQRRHGEAQAA